MSERDFEKKKNEKLKKECEDLHWELKGLKETIVIYINLKV